MADGGYDELSPLLRWLNAQQKQIRQQCQALQQKQQEFEAVTKEIVLLDRKLVILSIHPVVRQLLNVDMSGVGSCILAVHCLKLQTLRKQTAEGVCVEKRCICQAECTNWMPAPFCRTKRYPIQASGFLRSIRNAFLSDSIAWRKAAPKKSAVGAWDFPLPCRVSLAKER